MTVQFLIDSSVRLFVSKSHKTWHCDLFSSLKPWCCSFVGFNMMETYFFIFNLLSLPLIFNFKHTVFFSSLTLQSHQNLQLRNVIYYQTFNFLPPCGDRITGPPVQCARRGFFFIKTTGCSQKKPQKEKVEWTIDQLKTNRWNCSMQNHKRW